MADLEQTVDITGGMSQTDLNTQDISNIIDELNLNNASINNLGQTFSIATILNEDYTLTTQDLINTYVSLSFPHGLSFVPLVSGSVANTNDGSIRMLPALIHGAQSYYHYAYGGFSGSIVIESIDESNVNIRVDIIDALGLSVFASKGTLSFVLYCYVQPATTSSS